MTEANFKVLKNFNMDKRSVKTLREAKYELKMPMSMILRRILYFFEEHSDILEKIIKEEDDQE